MIAIQYIGGKPLKYDNVAGTGLVWTPDQVHVVSDSDGTKLLLHSGVWAMAEDYEVKEVGLPQLPEKQEVERVEIPFVDLDLATATKEDLAAYAQREFNVKLDGRRARDGLAREVLTLIEGRNRFPVEGEA
jgi:hypothetical protein